MDLLVIRHAVAGDRDAWAKTGRPDRERPVTPEGDTRMRVNAMALRVLVPDLGIVGTSPFTRAAQTAAIVSEVFGGLDVAEVPGLAHGGRFVDVRDWLARRRESHVAVVGHEPDLGGLISWFLTGDPEPLMGLKKGGACLLRFDGAPAPGRADLRWLLPPKVLRRMHD